MQDEGNTTALGAATNAVMEELALKDRALAAAAEGITIADARMPDNPLIYANEGFERLTGYSASEVLGRNCRFLQGPGTDPGSVNAIRTAVRERRECAVLLLNYRKDGSTFWNRLSINPVRDAAGDVTHFIGIQSDVTKEKNAQDALSKAYDELAAATRQLRGDLEMAAQVQRSFLPARMPDAPGAAFASLYRPCTELAGDIFNVFPLDAGRFAMYMLDVSGHGVAAALLSVHVSRALSPVQYVRSAAVVGDAPDALLSDPVAVVKALNRQFRWDERRPQYLTIVYGVLDTATREFRYVSAGHCDPIVVSTDGRARSLSGGGMPVGLFAAAEYEEQAVRLNAGERLYIYTDGLAEAENDSGEAFGFPRVLRAFEAGRVQSLQSSLDAVLSEVERWHGTGGLPDDVSLLAAEIGR